MNPETQRNSNYKAFYETQHTVRGDYASETEAEKHFEFKTLSKFLDDYRLRHSRSLEIGCARGAFQDMVSDYTGVDISPTLGKYIKHSKRFICAPASALPFRDQEFEVLWSIYCLEHVPELSEALHEIRRVVCRGGYLYLRPAYNIPCWVSSGISVRPYRELTLSKKFTKATVVIRNNRLIKGPFILSRRLKIQINYRTKHRPRPMPLEYVRLRPDYSTFWTSDSDACNGIDLFALALWFRDRGDKLLSPASLLKCFFSPSIPLIIRKGDHV